MDRAEVLRDYARMAGHAPIRAIVGRFFYDYSYSAIEQVLQEMPFTFIAHVSSGKDPKYFSSLSEEDQEWFISSEIRNCEYRGADWASFQPLDEDIVESMRACESVFLEMVARLEWKREIPYHVRKRWYLQHLRFWNDYIERKKINLYLSAWTPHEIPDIVIYELCKHKKIPILFFECANTVRDTSFAESDWEEGAPQLKTRYQELLQQYAGVTDPADIPLSTGYEERWKALTEPEGSAPPAYYKQWKPYWRRMRRTICKMPFKFLQIILSYLTPAGIRTAIGATERRWIMRKRNAFYTAHTVTPDFGKSFVYFPLHFQPELATTPLAGAFADQVLMAQMLNAVLPEGTFIYVKEHPWDSGWLARTIDDYRDYLALPKVRLIARSVDTFTLREHCKAVVTATGTAGFEALFRGKPVILFGHRFYQYAPGVHGIRSIADCAKAVDDIFEKKKAPSPLECRLHLKAMEDVRVYGVLDQEHVDVSELTPADHARSHSTAILCQLRKWF